VTSLITDPAIVEFILAFADDEHLMGQQHTEWIGVAPFLEADMAMASIGQDELGHAARLFELIAGEADASVDALAFGRSPAEYRSCHLVEYATTSWAEHLVRHLLYDAAEELRWELVRESSLEPLGALASHVAREESFHRRHADGLVIALLEDRNAMSEMFAALRSLLPMALAMFEPVAGEQAAIEAGVTSGPFATQVPAWSQRIETVFTQVRWDVEEISQQARTVRSDDFAPLLARMREVIDLDHDAVW